MDAEIDFTLLPIEDLQDEYAKLKERYKQQSEVIENDAQQIHDLKRSLETALAAKAFLAQELEQFTSANNSQEADNCHKLRTQLDELRRKNRKLNNEYTNFQTKAAALIEENEENHRIVATLRAMQQKRKHDKTDDLAESEKRLGSLECENLELVEKLEEYRQDIVDYTMAIAERDRNICILKEQLNCLEENIRAKRDELEERTQLLESTQEQLTDANAKIAMLTSSPDNNDRKGNSLFAEVDDQRQAMKQLLAAQKKRYMEMKKVYKESEYEIRRLKRENMAMHTELQTCSSIFCNADRVYHKKLNEQLRYLVGLIGGLETKLKWTEERLKELADPYNDLCVDSIFNFCKLETEDLKKKLNAVHIQKASLEEQLRNVTQDMARWRFESLKSRCILLDRENLLSQHKIAFMPNTALEFKITDEQIERARPRIVNNTPTTVLGVASIAAGIKNVQNDETTSDSESKSESKSESESESQSQSQSESDNSITPPPSVEEINLTTPPLLVSLQQEFDDTEDKENMLVRNANDSLLMMHEKESSQLLIPNTSQVCTSPVPKKKCFPNDIQQLKLSPSGSDSLKTRPIISKTRDLFGKDTEKNVKFSPNEPTVHNLSGNRSLQQDAPTNDEKSTTKITEFRKRNVTVRHVTIKPPPDRSD